MIRYIHGSGNSTDIDIHYVMDQIPDLSECKKFCSSDPNENRNIITISNGIVTGCYKGTVDEINNALLRTYHLHEQTSPLLVNRLVERVKPLKYVRGIRVILSHLSRSQYRPEVKYALRNGFSVRLNTLTDIDLNRIDFNTLNNNMTAEDIAKTIAFQIGQMFALLTENIELYTKDEISEKYPELECFMNRELFDDNLRCKLNKALQTLLVQMKEHISFEDTSNNSVTFFNEYSTCPLTIELIHEKIIK